ncbi:MAG TPA: L,D-transpeptidase, partial [Candidatus Kapabacteria bacterium]|nr:L,D-transpeptidase [Candidatus Kapabacteria bacterium]
MRTALRMYVLMFVIAIAASSVVAQTTGPVSPKPSAKTPNRTLTIKSLLKDRGYWISKVDSIQNEEYRSAVTAFRKVNGLKHEKKFSDAQFEALERSSRPQPQQKFLIYPEQDTERAHIEVDLMRQVLFVVDSLGTVVRILPVSSGNGKPFTTVRPDGTEYTRNAITPAGQFRISRIIKGWRKSELGELFYPIYFRGGAAVHGARSVPNFPASHGCVRIPLFAAEELARSVSVLHPILVHR